MGRLSRAEVRLRDPAFVARLVLRFPAAQDEIMRILALSDRETLEAVRGRIDAAIARADAILGAIQSGTYGRLFVADYTPEQANALVTAADRARGNALVAEYNARLRQEKLAKRDATVAAGTEP